MDIVRAKGQFPGCKVDDDLDVQLIAAIETLFVVISQPKYERWHLAELPLAWT